VSARELKRKESLFRNVFFSEKTLCIHLAEPLSIDNQAIVAFGAVLHTRSYLPPPVGCTLYTVSDGRTSTSAAARVALLTTTKRQHTYTLNDDHNNNNDHNNDDNNNNNNSKR